MNPFTGKVSSMIEMIDGLRKSPEIMEQVTYWHTIPPRDPKLAEFPEGLHEGIRAALRHKNIGQLYTHQAESFRQVTAGIMSLP